MGWAAPPLEAAEVAVLVAFLAEAVRWTARAGIAWEAAPSAVAAVLADAPATDAVFPASAELLAASAPAPARGCFPAGVPGLAHSGGRGTGSAADRSY